MQKGRENYGIYVCATGSGKMGHFGTTGTDTLQPEPHTGRFKTLVYVADTQGRGKADLREIKTEKGVTP